MRCAGFGSRCQDLVATRPLRIETPRDIVAGWRPRYLFFPAPLIAGNDTSMNIYWIQQLWFNDHYNPTKNVERHFLDIKDFGTLNVAVTRALSFGERIQQAGRHQRNSSKASL
jgi:hypothetical protein